MLTETQILARMPYTEPFLFVNELESVTESGVRGSYTFRDDAFFYQGHFKNNPVTPGVILTECCAQIGVVALGIFLTGSRSENEILGIGMSSAQMDFLKPVFPNEKVYVVSEKIYFRFHKLRCKVKMFNSTGDWVCKGEIAGMLKTIIE